MPPSAAISVPASAGNMVRIGCVNISRKNRSSIPLGDNAAMTKPASAGLELADRISRSLEAAHYEPGSIIGSEQELREQHNAGRALFRQAMRILEYRGIIRLRRGLGGGVRSEEHTSELQSLMRISYAVFCLKKKN